MSEYTLKLRKKAKLFHIISFLLWFVTSFVYIIIAYSRKEPQTAINNVDQATEGILSETAKATIVSLATTCIIGLLGAILIKDKVRTFIWMINLILSVMLFGEVGMYITLSIWFIEEYIFYTLYKKYKNLVVINKEIDKR